MRTTDQIISTKRLPPPRVDKKRKLVCVFSEELEMFEVRAITEKGKVSKMFAAQTHFTYDVREAFRHFTVPFAGFRAVFGVDKKQFKSWNEYIEGVWLAAQKKSVTKQSLYHET